MAIFQKKQPKEKRAAISQALSDTPDKADAQTATTEAAQAQSSSAVSSRRNEKQGKHQFDDIGIKYETKSHKRLVFGLIALLLIVAAVILVATPQGQSIVWQITGQNSTSSASSSVETQTSTSQSSVTTMPLIAPRDFSEATNDEIKQRLQSDVGDLDTILNNPTGFDTPDWQLELGL